MGQIGIITEQGDLGLGFDALNKKDTKAYNEANNKNSTRDYGNSQVIVENGEKK